MNLLAAAAALGAALAAGPAAPVPLPVPLGSAPLPLEVGLTVRLAGGGAGGAVPLGWQTRADGALAGRGAGAAFDAEVVLAPAPGGAREVQVRVGWRAPAAVERIALDLRWAGAPRAVDRHLAFGPVAGPLRTGRGTPLLVAGGAAVLSGGAGLAGAAIEAGPGPTAAVTLLLDDADERPFSTYLECLDVLPGAPDQPVRYADLERRRPRRGAARRLGDADLARALLLPLGPEEAGPFRPVVVERWPALARAAVVFTDHADRTDPDALRAVLWGHSDPRAAGGVGAGFLGRGVRLTRTFFVHARRGALDDPEARILARDLEDEGSEVALHSVTPERDRRDEVAAGLAAAAAFRPRTWIDHQPYTNCEAISSRGLDGAGPFAAGDLLAAAGVRWVWPATDAPGGGARIVNLLGGDPAAPAPAIFPLPGGALWAFRSSLFWEPPAALAAALSDPALARLEDERGLFVAHTYLGPGPATTQRPEHLARLAVGPAPGGGLAIDPDLDRALARIAARAAEGRLASLGWAEAGDRLRALGEVEVAYGPDGSAEVRNRGEAPIPGLTIAVPAAGLSLTVNGLPPDRVEEDGPWLRAAFDLPAGGRAVLRLDDGVLPVPFLPR